MHFKIIACYIVVLQVCQSESVGVLTALHSGEFSSDTYDFLARKSIQNAKGNKIQPARMSADFPFKNYPNDDENLSGEGSGNEDKIATKEQPKPNPDNYNVHSKYESANDDLAVAEKISGKNDDDISFAEENQLNVSTADPLISEDYSQSIAHTTELTSRTQEPTSKSTIQVTTQASFKSTTTQKTDDPVCTNKQCDEEDPIIMPEYQSHLPGQNITLNCTATNTKTRNQFHWYFSSRDEKTEDLYLSNLSFLGIPKVALEHTGKYTCVVTDQNGCCTKTATANVVVYTKPEYLTHLFVLVGSTLGLLLLLCLPMTLYVRRRYIKLGTSEQTEDSEKLTL